MSQPVLYTDLAPYYDSIVERDTTREIEFLADLLRENGSKRMLDLGCGNGRHSCGLTERGFEVVGVDANEPMLERARRHCNADFREADLRALEFTAEFDAAALMWSTVNIFTRKSELRSVFESVWDALESDGLFVVDTHLYPGDDESEGTRTVETDEVEIEIQSEKRYEDGYRHSNYTYEVFDRRTGDRRTLTDRVTTRFYSLQTYRTLLTQAGFEVTGTFGDYDRSEFTADSDRLLLEAKKR